MAYNHDGDLPETYGLARVAELLRVPQLFELEHRQSEDGNYLNTLGHHAIDTTLRGTDEPIGVGLSNLGIRMYEVITQPKHVNPDDAVNTPRYKDPGGMQVAMEVAHTLAYFTPPETIHTTRRAVEILDQEAPVLAGLIGWSSREIIEDLTDSELYNIKAGAALMRTLHITGQFRSDGGDFSEFN